MTIRCNLFAMLLGAVSLTAPFTSAAVPFEVNATGEVTDVFESDPFGTQVGDVITLHALFDSTTLVNVSMIAGVPVTGVQYASLSTPAFAMLSISMRGQHWSATDDSAFGFGSTVKLPSVILQSGDFVGLNFFGIGSAHNVFLNDARDSLAGFLPPGIIFGGNDDPDAPPFWIGFWNLDRALVSAVPEPHGAALVLLAVAVLALSSCRRD